MGLTKDNFYKKPEYTIETSWDDGGELDMRIVNLLKKYNLPGTFYITLDCVDKQGFLTWDQIKEIDSMGFKIGSHTVSHPMDLKQLFEEDLFVEIQNSKDLIETALGHPIESFAYPRGRADDRVKEAVARAGYLNARGTGKPGITTIEDKYYLPGTIHIFQRPEYEGKPIVQFAKEVIDRVKTEGGYCNIFGHSFEIEKNNLWGILEEVLDYARKK